MTKAWRITLLVVAGILLTFVSLGAVIAFGLSGIMGNFHIVLGLCLGVLTAIAIIFYARLVFITVKNIQYSLTQDILRYIFCFVLILLVLTPIFYERFLWCVEARIKNIELLSGTCWYN